MTYTASTKKALIKNSITQGKYGIVCISDREIIQQTGSNLLNAANTAFYAENIVISIFIKLDYSGTHSP